MIGFDFIKWLYLTVVGIGASSAVLINSISSLESFKNI